MKLLSKISQSLSALYTSLLLLRLRWGLEGIERWGYGQQGPELQSSSTHQSSQGRDLGEKWQSAAAVSGNNGEVRLGGEEESWVMADGGRQVWANEPKKASERFRWRVRKLDRVRLENWRWWQTERETRQCEVWARWTGACRGDAHTDANSCFMQTRWSAPIWLWFDCWRAAGEITCFQKAPRVIFLHVCVCSSWKSDVLLAAKQSSKWQMMTWQKTEQEEVAQSVI